MNTPHAVITLEAVSKRYGSTMIVHDLSFTVERGEIVGFLGPNGAGKTTTMRMIAGFTAATSGRVVVAGYDMATQNVEAARRIGYLPERPPLYDALDLRLPAVRGEGQGGAPRRHRVGAGARECGLPPGGRVPSRDLQALEGVSSAPGAGSGPARRPGGAPAG
jgi:ABC-2 type transport system ATP-binding protein